ncbi:MAG TPA: hypothetical protein VN673_17010, partial [Clostridia bacterium]|nr:hypothetical protein [Clostridia bacterium]
MAEPAFNAQHLSNRRAFPLAIAAWCGWAAMSPAAGFTPTEPVPLRVTRASTAYPGNRFEAPQLVDGNYRTEYASDNLGTNTFCEVDFGRTTTVAAFRHVDRDDRALVAGSSLEFFDEQGNRVATYAVAHSAARSGETFFPLPQPVTARRAAWRVTQLGPHGIGTVGGAELLFYQGGPVEPSPAGDRVQARALPFADRQGTQPARVTIEHWYLENAEA